MTPREFQAHSKVMDRAREFALGMVAGVQATLHNAHFRHKSADPVFRAEQFMPGYREPPKRRNNGLELILKGAPTYSKEEIAEANGAMADRTARAAQAKMRGEPANVIRGIMEGAA